MASVAFVLAGLLLLGIAVLVMFYVAYPHRGKEAAHARWANHAVTRAASYVRSEGPQPDDGMLVDHSRDLEMRDRMRRVERVVTGGLSGK